MRVIEKISEMQQQAEIWRTEGKHISLVPTMGYLHEGHLSLVRKARDIGDAVVVSIFVNPTQFGPGEDYERYPQDLERDFNLLKELNVDVVFTPSAKQMYPQGYQTYVEVIELTKPLCGKSRPGHFRGVTTIVNKLFNIVKPHSAVFGEKDFQQLITIQKMVEDLNMGVEIIGCPTVRESDGLAMSSRNAYLLPDERKAARRLSQSLEMAKQLVADKQNDARIIIDKLRQFLQQDSHIRVDYLHLCDPQTLDEVSRIDNATLLALAAYVGKARLIDNCIIHPSG